MNKQNPRKEGKMAGLFATLIVIAIYILVMREISTRKSDYNRGWQDRDDLLKLHEMSPDDEALLKELKAAVKLYIKQTGLYRSGDIKKLESATDFKEFKDEAWMVTVKRKEEK